MAVHKIERQQLIHADIKEVWSFFSNPENLSRITPEYMNFRTTSAKWEKEIYTGQIITYKVSPILGIPLSWTTEIKEVKHAEQFVDEQRKGPYKMWHHQHFFEKTEDGTLMTDIVHYELPLYILGELAHQLFVKQQLKNIFEYRYETVEQIFNQRQ